MKRHWTGLASLLLCLAAGGWAHEDPWGYVHPIILTHGSRFHVYYHDRTDQRTKPDDEGHPRYAELKDIYARDGKILHGGVEYARPDALLQRREDREARLRKRAGDVRASKLVLTGGSLYAFRYECCSGASHKPYCWRLAQNGKERIDFPWANTGLDWVSDVVVEGDSVAFLVSRYRQHALPSTDGIVQYLMIDGDLLLALFSLGKPHKREVINLGCPAFIYSFPRCSNLLVHEGRYIVAWVGKYSREVEPHSLMLSVWNPETQEETKVRQVRNASCNTSISIANIGNDLLIAWHQEDQAQGFAEAKKTGRLHLSFIHTVHVDLAHVGGNRGDNE